MWKYADLTVNDKAEMAVVFARLKSSYHGCKRETNEAGTALYNKDTKTDSDLNDAEEDRKKLVGPMYRFILRVCRSRTYQ